MCGRYARYTPLADFAERLGLEPLAGGPAPRYNIPPGTSIDIVARPGGAPARFALAAWGFRPPWAGADAPRPINARAESVGRSRYFAQAFREARCLVPADGWYEWARDRDGHKQPYYFSTGEPLMFAAIFAPGREDDSEPGVAILTEPARGVGRDIHPRMPVVLHPRCWSAWLDPANHDRHAIRHAVESVPGEQLRLWPVSPRVNRPEQDDPGLIERVVGTESG